ncbi:DUF2746 domain-containing protein [Gordonia alkaliphila]|uniref:DUF2746 domain-containing protein n=1 Tax=Gordonia alkaliphila TaxID=1053547 RepID=A0ABP8ZJX6_9ACTN
MGTPPLIWLAAVIVIALIAALPSLVVSIRNGKHAVSAAADVQVVREQVENDHDSNFRDDLDRTTEKVEAVDTKVDRLTGVVESMERQQAAFMREIRAQITRQDLIARTHHPEEYS